MERESRNIYKNARIAAGLTQERWAEYVGCSPDSVRNYEAGRQAPSDELVARMCEVSGVTALGYWHLRGKSALAADTLPEVERVPLPQAVCELLCAMRAFDACGLDDELLALAADGKIDRMEQAAFAQIVRELGRIVRAAMQVKYAEGGNM